MKVLIPLAMLALASSPVLAQDHSHMGHMTSAPVSAEGKGEIRKINAAAGTLTLQHGPIPALSWPSMTMGFVADPALLKGLKAGQKVVFSVRPADPPVITAIKVQ